MSLDPATSILSMLYPVLPLWLVYSLSLPVIDSSVCCVSMSVGGLWVYMKLCFRFVSLHDSNLAPCYEWDSELWFLRAWDCLAAVISCLARWAREDNGRDKWSSVTVTNIDHQIPATSEEQGLAEQIHNFPYQTQYLTLPGFKNPEIRPQLQPEPAQSG